MESLRYLMFLMWVYYFLQGMGGNPGPHIQALQKFMKETLHFTPTEASLFSMLTLTIPWSIKPLYGLISDFLPIFRLRRKSYFLISSTLAAAAYLTLAYLGVTKNHLMILLSVSAICVAFADVLCDAVMVEKGQPLNATDRLQAMQWAAAGVAGIAIAASKGYIAQYWSLKNALLLTAAAPVLTVLFTLLFLKERPVTSYKKSAKRAWGGLKKAVKSKTLRGAAIFLFLFQCNPHLGDAFYYYQKDVLKFSDVTIGHLATVGSITFVIGTFLYPRFAKRWPYEKLLRGVIISGALGNLMYYYYRGLHSAYIIDALNPLVSIIAFLGTLTIAAKVCPKYAEGVTFALLMSVFNLGTGAGNVIGAKLYEHIGYSKLMIISAFLTAAMWLALPLVREKKKLKKKI